MIFSILILIFGFITIHSLESYMKDKRSDDYLESDNGDNQWNHDEHNKQISSVTRIVVHKHYNYCLWSFKNHPDFETLDWNYVIESSPNNCNQAVCKPGIGNYTVNANEKIKNIIVNYYQSTSVYTNGSLTLLKFGKVMEGYFEGADVVVGVILPNDKPEACFTETGVTFLRSSIATITFQRNDKQRFTCFGIVTNKFEPGLRSPH